MTKYHPYKEFISSAYRNYNNPKEMPVGNPQRIGQHLMNCLYDEHPRLYNVVISSPFQVDPFYNNKRIPAFLEFIEKYWEDEN